MTRIRTYRMTIASTWYDEDARRVREYEMHFKVARRGRIRNIRRRLARRGVAYFQQTIYRRHRLWIPKRKVRVSFEREEPAEKTEPTIGIEVRTMEGRGRRWRARPLPPRALSYAKRRRRR